MKLYIEVEIDNVKNIEEVIELLDIQFVDMYSDNGSSWTATELYDESNDTVPEIKGYNIFTNLEGKLINTITENVKLGDNNE